MLGVIIQLQWSHFKTVTIEEVKFVLYKKVSFIQGLNTFWTYTNVLYIEGVLLQGVLLYNLVLEITVGHWPFSDQFEHLADQNLF